MVYRMKQFMCLTAILLSLTLACQRSATKVQEFPSRETPEVKPPAREPEPTTMIPQEETEPEKPQQLVFEKVQFDFDKYTLTEQARQILAGHARKLSENPAVKLLIEGHCDEWGTIEYNLALGEKRADTVKQYLVSYGIDSSRLSTISYGKERPLDPAHNEQAWAKNRRADFVITEGDSR
jgi:peptidoglycan-associated lipoprotein